MVSMNVNCPKCKAIFKVDEVHLGKKGRCTKCGEKFIISKPREGEGASPDVGQGTPRFLSEAAADTHYPAPSRQQHCLPKRYCKSSP